METVLYRVVKMAVFTMKNMKRVRGSTGVRESVGANWINIRPQGAGAGVRDHGLLKHTRAHAELLESPADKLSNPAAGHIDNIV